MNRVLCWPHTPILPGLLDGLKGERHGTVVTARGTIRFDLFLGPVEMKFSNPQQQLPQGTHVFVWWKGGGFVCAAANEIDDDEQESRDIAERVLRARKLRQKRRSQQ